MCNYEVDLKEDVVALKLSKEVKLHHGEIKHGTICCSFSYCNCFEIVHKIILQVFKYNNAIQLLNYYQSITKMINKIATESKFVLNNTNNEYKLNNIKLDNIKLTDDSLIITNNNPYLYFLGLSKLELLERKEFYIRIIERYTSLIESMKIPDDLTLLVDRFYNNIDLSEYYTPFFNKLMSISDEYSELKALLKLPIRDCKKNNKLHHKTILSSINDKRFHYEVVRWTSDPILYYHVREKDNSFDLCSYQLDENDENDEFKTCKDIALGYNRHDVLQTIDRKDDPELYAEILETGNIKEYSHLYRCKECKSFEEKDTPLQMRYFAGHAWTTPENFVLILKQKSKPACAYMPTEGDNKGKICNSPKVIIFGNETNFRNEISFYPSSRDRCSVCHNKTGNTEFMNKLFEELEEQWDA